MVCWLVAWLFAWLVGLANINPACSRTINDNQAWRRRPPNPTDYAFGNSRSGLPDRPDRVGFAFMPDPCMFVFYSLSIDPIIFPHNSQCIRIFFPILGPRPSAQGPARIVITTGNAHIRKTDKIKSVGKSMKLVGIGLRMGGMVVNKPPAWLSVASGGRTPPTSYMCFAEIACSVTTSFCSVGGMYYLWYLPF